MRLTAIEQHQVITMHPPDRRALLQNESRSRHRLYQIRKFGVPQLRRVMLALAVYIIAKFNGEKEYDMKTTESIRLILLFSFALLCFHVFPAELFCQETIWAKKDSGAGLQIFVDAEQKIYFAIGTGNGRYVIKKYEPSGIEIWSMPVTIQPLYGYTLFADMAINNENIYILFPHPALLIKYNSNRTLVWQIPLQLRGRAEALCVNGSGIFLAGTKTFSDLKIGAWISKFDTSGVQKWEKTFDYGDWHNIEVKDMDVDQKGNIFIVGHEYWVAGNIFIAKFDSTGNILWDKRVGTSDDEEAWRVKTDYENNVIVYGYIGRVWTTYQNTGWFGKFNTTGEEIFTKTTYNGNEWGIMFPKGLAIDHENNIYIGGNGGETGGFISKYDKNGIKSWEFKPAQWRDWPNYIPNDIASDNHNDIYFIGDSTNYVIYGKIGIIPTSVDENKGIFPQSYVLKQNYPNPFNPVTTIEYQLPKDSYVTLRVFNIRGELVKTCIEEKQSSGGYKTQWNGIDENGNSVASGLYLYQLKADDFSQLNKMILVR